MAAKDSLRARGMIYVLLHFPWTWVALFVSDDLKGEQLLWDFKSEMEKKMSVWPLHRCSPELREWKG